MSSKESILQYGLCIMCNSNLAKLGSSYCKKCKIKPMKNRVKNDDSCKIYYYKFRDKNTKARLRLNSSKTNIGYSLCIEPSLSNTRPFSPIKNSELFVLTTWNQFRSLKEFASCIIQSDQISFAYFIISCSTFVQNLPKYQHFIKCKVIDLPPDSLANNTILPYPLTSPLQLLYQQSFWDELLSIYFKEFHLMCPLISIQSFDKKTASHSLLSAMYYCAYQLRSNQPKQISEYMEKLATQNIKKAVKCTTLDNVRTLIIHAYICQWIGNLKLAKSLQAHLSRMCYSLGLHLNYNNLSPTDRYNRDIIYCMARMINLGLSGSHNFTPNYLADFGKAESYLYDIKWQIPGPNSPIYSENQMENRLYSHCLSIFLKFVDNTSKIVWFPFFYKLESNSFNKIWNSKVNKLKEIFENTMQSLGDLKENYSEFKASITPFEIHVEMTYHEASIEMYELLKHKNKTLQPSNVSAILDHCHNLYQILATADNYNSYFQFFAHIVGLHYLNMYPRCNTSEKLRTKQRLLDLILFMKDRFYSYFSLNYLILKTGYDSLDDN